jgi:thymidylate synthase (FAD)
MDEIAAAYSDLSDLLAEETSPDTLENKDEAAKVKEKIRQDARFVLPQAAETRLVMTMNCRSLLNFFEERCCSRAQWEIRALATSMLKLARTAVPIIFDTAGAKCVRLGYCPEGERFTCRRVARRP